MSLEQLEAMVAAPETAPMPCKPYDVPAYLGRIATYRSAADWFDKPAAIAPPVCARFGWSLAGHDLLSCGVCGAFLKAPAQLTAVDPAEEGEGADGPTATFARQLSSGHGDLCPWKGNASPQSIGALLLPGSLGMLPSLPHGTSISKEAVRKRAASLLGLPSLPALAPAAEALWAECAAACGFQEGGDAAAVGAWQGRRHSTRWVRPRPRHALPARAPTASRRVEPRRPRLGGRQDARHAHVRGGRAHRRAVVVRGACARAHRRGGGHRRRRSRHQAAVRPSCGAPAVEPVARRVRGGPPPSVDALRGVAPRGHAVRFAGIARRRGEGQRCERRRCNERGGFAPALGVLIAHVSIRSLAPPLAPGGRERGHTPGAAGGA